MATFGFYGLNYREKVEDRCVHAAMRLTSIEFSFDPCNIYRYGPRGVGYPADARSVGDSHPSCLYGQQSLKPGQVHFLTPKQHSESSNSSLFKNELIIYLLLTITITSAFGLSHLV